MWSDLARPGGAWSDMVGSGQICSDLARSGRTWPDPVGSGQIWSCAMTSAPTEVHAHCIIAEVVGGVLLNMHIIHKEILGKKLSQSFPVK